MALDQYERDVTMARQTLGEADFATAWAEGRVIPPSELLAAARAALGALAEPELSTRRSMPARHALLTAREQEVLRLVAEGRSDREIGTILYIGTRTVEYHVANIIGKLSVANRRDAAATAARLGLI
jgi:DNA-binding NarL/FixJ family response regulator